MKRWIRCSSNDKNANLDERIQYYRDNYTNKWGDVDLDVVEDELDKLDVVRLEDIKFLSALRPNILSYPDMGKELVNKADYDTLNYIATGGYRDDSGFPYPWKVLYRNDLPRSIVEKLPDFLDLKDVIKLHKKYPQYSQLIEDRLADNVDRFRNDDKMPLKGVISNIRRFEDPNDYEFMIKYFPELSPSLAKVQIDSGFCDRLYEHLRRAGCSGLIVQEAIDDLEYKYTGKYIKTDKLIDEVASSLFERLTGDGEDMDRDEREHTYSWLQDIVPDAVTATVQDTNKR